MTFAFEKERITALSDDGILMGHIAFPRVRAGLVNISHVATQRQFRGQGVAEAMMEALLSHLDELGWKAALTCPFAQNYMAEHPQWKRILPGKLHMTSH